MNGMIFSGGARDGEECAAMSHDGHGVETDPIFQATKVRSDSET